MKKIIAAILGIIIMCSLVACGNDDVAPTSEISSEATAAPTEEPEERIYQSEIDSEKGCSLTLYDEELSKPNERHVVFPFPNRDESPMDTTDELAFQFVATTSVKYIELSTATFQAENVSVELALYVWNDTYEDTVAGEPVASTKITGIEDNQKIKFEFEEEFEANEYLLVVSKPSGSFTVYAIPYEDGVEYPYTRSYANGLVVTGYMPQAKVRYVNTPVEMRMEISA